MRPLGFCRHLSAHGWMPHVLTTTVDSINPRPGTDPALETGVPASVVVDRVPHGDLTQRAIRLRNAVFRRQPTAGGPDGESSQPLRKKTGRHPLDPRAVVLDHLLQYPDQYAPWLRPAVRRGLQINRTARIDAVLATGKPWTGLLVGQRLARRLGVPFVADFRDPWTRNAYNGPRSSALHARDKKVERDVCLSASFVIANTEELRRQFAEDYPDLRDRFLTITNGFDDSAESNPQDLAPPGSTHDSAGVELWHFGTLYGNRDPLALLTAVSRLRANGVLGAETFRLHLVGSWLVTNSETNRLAEALQGQGVVVRTNSVPHAECLRLMRAAPALLALQPASPLQIPAKIYEYVATGRPLVVVGGEGATAALVDRHRLGRCCANRADAIESLLRGMLGGERLATPDPAACATFSYRTLTTTLASRLDAVVEPRPAVGACA